MASGKAANTDRDGATASVPTRVEIAYSLPLVEAICAKIAGGAVLDKVLSEVGMPSRSTFYAWLRKYREANELYDDARLRRAEVRFDAVHQIVEDVKVGKIDPQSARTAIDGLKWLAAKENPQRFGDRVVTEHTGKDGKDLIPEREMSDLDLARWMAHVMEKGARQAEAQAANG